MKKYIALISIVSSLFALSSCQKAYNSAPDAPDQKNNTRGSFTCKINGYDFKAETKTAYRVDQDGVNNLTISGREYFSTRRPEDFYNISLTINWYDGAKEYNLPSEVGAAYIRSFTDEGVSNYLIPVNDENNKFILSEYGSNAIGTFSFKAVKSDNVYDTVTVTDGAFDFPID